MFEAAITTFVQYVMPIRKATDTRVLYSVGVGSIVALEFGVKTGQRHPILL